MEFKDIDAVQEFVKERLKGFDDAMDKSPLREGETNKKTLSLTITFNKVVYTVDCSIQTQSVL